MSKQYKCQLCYANDHFKTDFMSLEQFLDHLCDTHNSPKAQQIRIILEKFGGIEEVKK